MNRASKNSPTPYYRPLKKLPEGPEWLAPGLVLIRDALERLGQARFKNEWTGDEMFARDGPFDAPTPPSNEGITGRKLGYVTPYWDASLLRRMPFEQAMELYESEEEKLNEEWKAEPAIRNRFKQVFNELRGLLYLSRLEHEVIDDRAKPYRGAVEIWGTPKAEAFLKNGRVPIRVGNWKSEGWAVLSEADVQSLIDGTSASLSDVAENGQATSNDRASEPKYESEWMKLQLEAIKHFGITEENQTLKKHLIEWFKVQTVDGRPVTEYMAEYLATAVRSPKARHGGNKRSGKLKGSNPLDP